MSMATVAVTMPMLMKQNQTDNIYEQAKSTNDQDQDGIVNRLSFHESL